MKNKTSVISLIILLLIASTTIAYEIAQVDYTTYNRVYPELHISSIETIISPVHVLKTVPVDIVRIKNYTTFKHAVGFRESSGKYDVINKYGYIGKYQFGKSALKDLGITDRDKFLKDTSLQEQAFKSLCKINKYRLRNYINKYRGTYINNIKITESGMIAAAHLVGAGSVRKYLRSNGTKIKNDANGTTVEHYMELFKDYKLNIVAKRIIKLNS